jgi:hypothetical protein
VAPLAYFFQALGGASPVRYAIAAFTGNLGYILIVAGFAVIVAGLVALSG